MLFDFDGTLTLPGALDFPSIKRELGCPSNIPILEFLETQPVSHREELMVILESKEEQAAGESIPNVGAERCLSTLKERGVLLGIITRNSLKSVIRALKKFECIKLKDFAAIVTREDAPPKPHPKSIYQAALKMGLQTGELMVVGDFRFDVMAGKAAGVYTVLLTNGGRSSMLPGDPDPDYTINHLDELLILI
ncbi:MAG: HAD family hydrolase [Pseudomonadota bacterium]